MAVRFCRTVTNCTENLIVPHSSTHYPIIRGRLKNDGEKWRIVKGFVRVPRILLDFAKWCSNMARLVSLGTSVSADGVTCRLGTKRVTVV